MVLGVPLLKQYRVFEKKQEEEENNNSFYRFYRHSHCSNISAKEQTIFGHLKTINFPFGTNGKLMVLGVLMHKQFRYSKNNSFYRHSHRSNLCRQRADDQIYVCKFRKTFFRSFILLRISVQSL